MKLRAIQQAVWRSPSARASLGAGAISVVAIAGLVTIVAPGLASRRFVELALLVSLLALLGGIACSWWLFARPFEAILRENRRTLRSLFVENPEAIAVYDTGGKIVRGNKAAAAMMKRPVEGLIGAHFATHIAADAVDVANAAFDVAVGGGTIAFETVFLGANDERIDVRTTLFPYIVDDRVVGVFGVAKDIGDLKRANDVVREQSQELSELFDRNPNPMLVMDGETNRYVEVNQAALDLYGYSRAEFAELTPYLLRAPEEVAGVDEFLRGLRLTDRAAYDTVHLKANGTRIDIHVTIVTTLRAGREVRLINLQDMTELRQSQANVARAQSLGKNGNWWHDFTTDHTYWSDEMFAMFGLPKGAGPPKIPEPFRIFTHPDDVKLVSAAVAKAIALHKPCGVDHRSFRQDGSALWTRLEVTAEFDTLGRPTRLIGSVQDISERKSAEEALEHSAYFDRLTNLPNRLLLNQRLDAVIHASRDAKTSAAVFFIDVDDFKSVNDTLGHGAGDTLLATIADRLSANIRKTDFVARTGGDEFIAILTDIGSDARLAAIAFQLARSVSRPIRILDREISATISIGIAMFPLDGDDAETLIRNADMAMYAAKRSGRGDLRFFSDEMDGAAATRNRPGWEPRETFVTRAGS